MTAPRPNAPEGPLGRPEPWTSTVLRFLVHAITAGVIAWPLTVPSGVAAAALGAGAGSLLARFVARSTLRLPAIVALGVASLLGVVALRWLAVDLAFVPAALGPADALLAGDAIVFGLGGGVVSIVLRTLSARQPSFAILEAALVAGGFAALLVAHRHGAIHRPYDLADPIIARGEDPTLAILAIGSAGAAVVGLLLLSERSLLRSAFHLAVVAGLLVLIFFTTTMTGLPTPPSTGGALGLQDDDRESREGDGQGGGQGDRRSSDDLEFLDQYPSGGGAPDAVVIFHDDYSPPGGYYYFRQNAFSQYNGRKLVASTAADIDVDVHNVFPTSRSRDAEWAPLTGADRTSVETTVGLLADNSAPLALEAPVRFVPATNPNPERFRRMYRVESVSLTSDVGNLLGRPVGDPRWDEDARAHYLETPGDPRYAALAERIVAELPEHLRDEPIAKALAITQWLGERGTYSLQSRHADAEDPTAHFLFGDLTGYCVHFAHAAVYLMRSVGLPARVGTGYAVAEANRQGGSALLLRNSDQHAWPEVYFGRSDGTQVSSPELDALAALARAHDDGVPASPDWGQRADAMATILRAAEEELGFEVPSGVFYIDAVAQPGVTLERLSERLGKPVPTFFELAARRAVREAGGVLGRGSDAGWVVLDVSPETVLSPPGEPPDPQLQRLLGEMARGSQPIDEALQPPRPMSELAREAGRPLALGLLGFVLALVSLAYGNKLRRRLLRGRPRWIYRAAIDRLAEGGLRRRWGESPEAFAARLAVSLPSLRRLTDRHLAAAFGAHADEALRRRMLEDARVLRVEYGRTVPWWRRALGLINPFSWLLTR